MRCWSPSAIERAHLVAWSAGGGVAYRFIADHPAKVITVTLQAPVSPYGFGGSKGIEGTPCYDDCAGSGGGVVNPEFVKRIISGRPQRRRPELARATSSTPSTTSRRSAPRARRTS